MLGSVKLKRNIFIINYETNVVQVFVLIQARFYYIYTAAVFLSVLKRIMPERYLSV